MKANPLTENTFTKVEFGWNHEIEDAFEEF